MLNIHPHTASYGVHMQRAAISSASTTLDGRTAPRRPHEGARVAAAMRPLESNGSAVRAPQRHERYKRPQRRQVMGGQPQHVRKPVSLEVQEARARNKLQGVIDRQREAMKAADEAAKWLEMSTVAAEAAQARLRIAAHTARNTSNRVVALEKSRRAREDELRSILLERQAAFMQEQLSNTSRMLGPPAEQAGGSNDEANTARTRQGTIPIERARTL